MDITWDNTIGSSLSIQFASAGYFNADETKQNFLYKI